MLGKEIIMTKEILNFYNEYGGVIHQFQEGEWKFLDDAIGKLTLDEYHELVTHYVKFHNENSDDKYTMDELLNNKKLFAEILDDDYSADGIIVEVKEIEVDVFPKAGPLTPLMLYEFAKLHGVLNEPIRISYDSNEDWYSFSMKTVSRDDMSISYDEAYEEEHEDEEKEFILLELYRDDE